MYTYPLLIKTRVGFAKITRTPRCLECLDTSAGMRNIFLDDASKRILPYRNFCALNKRVGTNDVPLKII